MELDTITTRWQWALDAGGRALSPAAPEIRDGRLETHRKLFAHERAETEAVLERFASTAHASAHPWLAATPVSPAMLGLPPETESCIFDVDGVLVDGHAVHAAAWAQVFDDLLLRRSQEAGWHFVPFDADLDYRLYVDGRPRLDGVHAFLESRGIHVTHDEAERIARRKGQALAHATRVALRPGAHRYLLAAGFAHLRRGVVSTSSTTRRLLAAAGLEQLVETVVTTGRPRPAPDMLLAACSRLKVEPARTVSLTRSDAGLAAADAAGMHGILVQTLDRLLDPSLR